MRSSINTGPRLADWIALAAVIAVAFALLVTVIATLVLRAA
jgi:hypothetical protein